jgi:zinc transport system ATP-binding protein
MIAAAPPATALATDTDTILRLTGVSFAYDNVPVLRDVSFSIHARESVCIVGPNGGGKSTLLKLILGLLKPDSGEIELFGCRPKAGRHRIGYMPQMVHFDPMFPITVRDVVLMGKLDCISAGWFSRHHKKLAMEALAELDMADCADRRFSNLSGGQRQRVLIARALVCDPDLLLLDEPTANVDQAVEEDFYATLEKLNARMAIMLVSHDLGFVSRFVKSVICVNRAVHVHPTADLTGRDIREVYGEDMAAIRHDHRCSSEGHDHS